MDNHKVYKNTIYVKTVVLILSFILILSNSRVDKLYATEKIASDKSSFKILAVGNSLSFDTLYYVYDMAKDLGYEDVVVGNLYIGSCSIKRHWNNAKNNKPAYLYKKKYKDYSESHNGKWEESKNVSIEKALCDEDWDYIMLSQYSADNGKTKTYKHLNKLIKYVKNRTDKNTRIIWNMIWAFQGDYREKRFAYYKYDQQLMYKRIVKATKKKIVSNKGISKIVPTATVIQNARTSSFGDKLTKDGRHLNKKARYMASLGLICKLCDTTSKKIKYSPTGISLKVKRIAKKSVNKAISNPLKKSYIK